MDTLAPPLVAPYSPVPGIYDEMLARPGVSSPDWDAYAASISGAGKRRNGSPVEYGAAAIRENGVTL